MRFTVFANTARDAARAMLRTQEIGVVLMRSGAWGFLSAIGFEIGKRGLNLVKKTAQPAHHAAPQTFDSVMAVQLKRLLIDLGPTFIKLGQMLASRPDIVGATVSEELRSLFDSVPPVSFRRIKHILNVELGRRVVRERFRSIDTKPLGSASIAQTHRAVLKNGGPVILKIQKPGVSKTIRSDLVLMDGLARTGQLVYPKLQLRALFDDFKQATLREIDYREEAKNIARFQHNYKSLFVKTTVAFPNFIPDLTTERVIVLEPMRGTQVSTLKKGTTVARKAATKSLEAMLEQIFDHGFFHADPHAGNLFFMEDTGGVGFIDLGLVGSLEPDDKRRFLKVLFAILKRDRRLLAKSLFALGTPSAKTQVDLFEKAIDELLDDIKAQGLEKTHVEQLVTRLLEIARNEGVFIPNRYVLLLRSCLIIEGVAKGLDPKLSIAAIATPIVARSLLKSFNPLRMFRSHAGNKR